ncbi:flagellar M-ring protein FliF [Rhizobiales bacterium L72]|uniref:Flagellar M-ring protein n=1 Tax=Propylenella binzhouense TaxID=2555902 RepID=A0A964WSK5_9HYPH|nr:flagellar M-ring protein FliF [Propylenella binzhouense]
MLGREQLENLWANVIGLGSRRLAALALVGLSVFALVGLGGYYLSRPELVTLYTGLERDDVSRMGAALAEAGILFDVNAEGNAVLVRPGDTGHARMLLAEKGLPHSAGAGYELFDDLGSLGLTSFMQGVTRVRALEGELARTIQTMRGIRAARVHLVLADEGSFRRGSQPPSASVVIRSEGGDDAARAQAIRHLVAAAIPSMTAGEVTVLNTDGAILASGDGSVDLAPGKLVGLETKLGESIRDRIRTTLAPYLGLENFQVSVAARLNTDKRQISETVYDPDSRVERSVRVIRENQTSQNATSKPPTTVEQNIPNEQVGSEAADRSNEENDRREEVTNFEVSSKSTTTTSDGYVLDRLTVAVLVNRPRLLASLGESPSQDAIDAQMREIHDIVASASGYKADRGDDIKVSLVEFLGDEGKLDPVPAPGLSEILLRQSGTLINAGTILVIALLVIWFGLRPAASVLLQRFEPAVPGGASVAVAAVEPQLPSGTDDGIGAPALPAAEVSLIEDLTSKMTRTPQKRLEQMIQFDEEHAAAILKQWIHEGARA